MERKQIIVPSLRTDKDNPYSAQPMNLRYTCLLYTSGPFVSRFTVVARLALERRQPLLLGPPITVLYGKRISRLAVVAIAAVERSQPFVERSPVSFLDVYKRQP